MFARYFVELPMDPERVEEALLRDPHSWLPGLASEANFQGDTLLAEVGFGEEIRVARKVAIELGEPVRMPSKTVVPIRWTAVGASGLFPALEHRPASLPRGPARSDEALRTRSAPEARRCSTRAPCRRVHR